MFKHHNVSSQIKHMINFYPLEVVGCGSETQLPVNENSSSKNVQVCHQGKIQFNSKLCQRLQAISFDIPVVTY